MTSLNINDLLKDLFQNTVTLGIRTTTYGFGGNTIQSKWMYYFFQSASEIYLNSRFFQL